MHFRLSSLLKLTAIAVLAGGLFLPAPAAQAGRVSDGELKLMAEAIKRCLDHTPDMSEVSRAHRAARMRHEGNTADYDIFTAGHGDVLTFNARRDSNAICLFGVDGLQETNAEQVVQATIVLLEGQVGDELGPEYKTSTTWKAWPARISGKEVVIGVTRIQQFGNLYRGSLILIQDLQN